MRHRTMPLYFPLLLCVLTPFFGFVGCSDDKDDDASSTAKTDTTSKNTSNSNDSSNNTSASTAATLPKGVSCGANNLCTLSGVLTENYTLTKDKKWLLSGGFFVGDDKKAVTLTIEPGTTVYGESATKGMLVVTRGSKLMAEGTKAEPIVFTSSKLEGSRGRGDWGGLVLNGKAPINGCDLSKTAFCEAEGEGGTGSYGGKDSKDSSGALKYVRVEFAGQLISPENELNGVAFQGVGSGTTVDFLQVHMAADDCVEFFGGTVSVKHVLCTGIADDNVDWTSGWVGNAQFVLMQQYADAGDNGIEADNNGNDNDAKPRAKPTLSNITLIGSKDSEASDIGMLLRAGTAGYISNAIVIGFNEVGLDIDGAATFENALKTGSTTELSGELTVTNSLFFDSGKNFADVTGDESFSPEDFVLTMNTGNEVKDPMLAKPYDAKAPGFAPKSGSPAASGAVIPEGDFFDNVAFRGAVDPASDWTVGWTTAVVD